VHVRRAPGAARHSLALVCVRTARRGAAALLERGDHVMISRVADHCFWLGRYLERAESTARLLQVTAALALDAELTAEQCWSPLIITAGEEARFPELCGADAVGQGEPVQRYLTFDARVGVSLVRSVGAARENARSIREVISLEAWETLNALHLYLQGQQAQIDYAEERDGFFRRVRREVQLCVGLLQASMLHDHPLHFVALGSSLEQVSQTARILDVHYHAFSVGPGARDGSQVVAVSLWLSLLRACYGFEAFMKTHRGGVTAAAVAAFLIFEPRFPRSVVYGLQESAALVKLLRPPVTAPGGLHLTARLTELTTWLGERQAKGTLEETEVHALLTRVVDEAHALGDLVQLELIQSSSGTHLVGQQRQSQS
jgi:uncharacterized alpha-E superfamily protein